MCREISDHYLIPVTERQLEALYPFKSRGFGEEIGLDQLLNCYPTPPFSEVNKPFW